MTLLTFDEMVARLKLYLELESNLYPMILLFSLSARLKELFPNDLCLYISVVGSWSTGKTNTSQLITEISRGEWLELATDAYLLDAFDKNGNVKVIGLDQLDDQIERLDSIVSILEIGNKWDAKYGMKVKKSGKWESVQIPCGGPKVFNSLIPPRRTLSSRCLEIRMFPAVGKDSELLSARYKYRKNDVEDLAGSLDWYASDIKSKFDADDVQQFILSPVNLAKVKHLKKYSPRRVDIANIFEAVNDMVGWKADCVTPLQYEVMDEDTEAFRTVLADIVVNCGWLNGSPVKSDEVCSAVNERYRSIGWETFSPQAFGRRMVEMGFTDYSGYRIHRNDGTKYIFDNGSIGLLRPGFQVQVKWGTSHLKKVTD